MKSYFAKTKAALASKKAENKIKYIKNKSKIQMAKRINKDRLKRYRSLYNKAIRSGKTKVQHHFGVKGS
jgi:CRISPR/Cas system CMR subunit Cmr6 (Cas7 group RAMP superfamily)